MDAMNLPGIVDALLGSAIYQGGIVADHAFLGVAAVVAMDKAEIRVANGAIGAGDYLPAAATGLC